MELGPSVNYLTGPSHQGRFRGNGKDRQLHPGCSPSRLDVIWALIRRFESHDTLSQSQARTVSSFASAEQSTSPENQRFEPVFR